MRRIPSLRWGLIAVLSWTSMFSIIWSLLASGARAEIHISGSEAAVVVQAQNSSLSEIIDALSSTLNVQIRYSPTVNPAITGTYSGSLRQVISRMLAGHDYVLSSSGDRIAIILATHVSRDTVHSQAAKFDPSRASEKRNNVKNNYDTNNSAVQGWTAAFSNGPPQNATNETNQKSDPVIVDEPPNPSGIQGWAGAFSNR